MAEHVFTPEDNPRDGAGTHRLLQKMGPVAGYMRLRRGEVLRISHIHWPGEKPERAGGLLEGYDDVWVGDLPDEEREWLFSALIYKPDTGSHEFMCFCNPEPLLDMAFEGPLYNLLHQTWYRTELAELSPEGRDPTEFDCCEDYLEFAYLEDSFYSGDD